MFGTPLSARRTFAFRSAVTGPLRRVRRHSIPLAIARASTVFVLAGLVAVGSGLHDAAQAATSSLAWSSPADIDGGARVLSISCPSTSFCVATDNAGHALTYNGSTWSAPSDIDGSNALTVFCRSSSSCVAGDSAGNVLTYNGSTWSSPSNVDGTNDLLSISCPSASFCAAVDFSGNVLTYNGTSWSAASNIDGTTALNSVSCPTTTFCKAVDSAGNAFSYNGTTWSSADIDGTNPLVTVSCPTTSFCAAVGFAGHALTFNGVSWSAASDIDGTNDLIGASCPSATFCAAVDAVGNAFTFDGSSWSSPDNIDGTNRLVSVSCPSASFCAAVGFSGHALTASPGAVTLLWTAPADISSTNALSVSCVSSTFCIATDDFGNWMEWNGTVWSTPLNIESANIMIADACASTTLCFAVDGAGNAYKWNGTTWSGATDIDGSEFMSSITCQSTSLCWATDQAGKIVEWNGASWASPVTLDSGNIVQDISCATSTFCMAVDSHGSYFTWNGTSWTGPTLVDSRYIFTGVSCPTTTFCAVVDNGGNTWTWNGSSFSALFPMNPLNGLTDVSCPSATDCVAVGGNGAVGTWNGSAWSLPANGDAGRALDYVSCPTTSFCAAVDDVGFAIWAEPATPGPYTPVSPQRICDTRPNNPSSLSGNNAQCDGTLNRGRTLSSQGTLTINVTGEFGIPSTASAVVLNVTVVPQNPGYLTVFPAGQPSPTASNLNYTKGDVVPNLVEVGVGPGGQVSFYSYAATDVIVDLEGYTAPTSGLGVGGGLYNPLASPARICDTRSGNPSGLSGTNAQCNGKTMVAGSTLNVQVTGAGGVPGSGVSAVVLNVTVVAPVGPGYLTVWPEDVGTRPTASNLNYQANQVIPNRVIVPVSTTGLNLGQISIYTTTATDVLVDVSGWYSTSGGLSGYQFSAATNPVRICDTRSGNPSNLSGTYAQCNGHTLAAAGTIAVTTAGLASIPSGAKAVVLNVTAVLPSNFTYVTVYPSGSPPVVSDLNPYPGSVEPNLVVATLTGSGTFEIYNAAGSTDVVADVLGWYS